MSLTRIGSIGINTGIKFSGLTTITTLNTSIDTLSIGGPVSIAGTLTYEDVTNIDSVGLITARNGIVVGSGITLSKDGDGFFTGIVTATTFSGALSGSGANITAINASNISSGTVPTARLGSGTASSSTFLRGDSTFQTVNTDLVSDTSPQLGGNLDVNTKNIVFGDSSGATDDRLTFGEGTDLSIYHNGSHSYIDEAGTGNLYIRNGTKNSIWCQTDGQVKLYHNDSAKFETTGTGAVVTGILTATTFVPSEGQLANRNLIVNGAMRVAQRGTSYTGGYSAYYKTVDRQFVYAGGLPNTDVTTSQINITTGSPYDAGFRKAFQISMGYQGSTPADVQVAYSYRMEAQDLACSGWKHTSSSSYITLSFWVRSSVAQTFYGQLRTIDGTNYHYPFSYALSADTWTKVEKTIPGNSNLTLNNDNGEGLRIDLTPYYGTDYTNNSVSLNAWGTHSNSAKTPDQTATWYQTNGATWQITGLQLEVGQTATPFEHRSFGEDLALCQRYFFKNINESGESGCNYAKAYSTSELFTSQRFPVAMRAAPTITAYGNAGTAGTVHKLGSPDKTYDSIDRQDVYGGFRINKSGQWATGDTDMYSYTFQAEAEL